MLAAVSCLGGRFVCKRIAQKVALTMVVELTSKIMIWKCVFRIAYGVNIHDYDFALHGWKSIAFDRILWVGRRRLVSKFCIDVARDT